MAEPHACGSDGAGERFRARRALPRRGSEGARAR
eukprot:CAMPEP_0176320570 /NCGR_PEP_ID=MMETSP0121_2-20121125/70894_1 /TAXON_ID=160619 /ORGANISM="Kryptoperidinium foliaceum, Strain CCMP 1326" /LENGTH=33 /DNA_ID= /DNA_START= /DNA_END= /DNA_ORIENTATION=